jgi:hypothetical protein
MSSQNQNELPFNFIDYITGPVIHGDRAIAKKIVSVVATQEADWDVDECFLIFEWNISSLQTFLKKSLLLSADAPHPPPSLAGLPPAEVDIGVRMRFLMAGILDLVASKVGNEVIDGEGGIVGLFSSLYVQGLNSAIVIAGLKEDGWFAAVLEAGEPILEPLATVHLPRPGVANGQCDALTIGNVLWK